MGYLSFPVSNRYVVFRCVVTITVSILKLLIFAVIYYIIDMHSGDLQHGVIGSKILTRGTASNKNEIRLTLLVNWYVCSCYMHMKLSLCSAFAVIIVLVLRFHGDLNGGITITVYMFFVKGGSRNHWRLILSCLQINLPNRSEAFLKHL